MEIKHASGRPITDWRDWVRPKKASQWAPGRSAMELARAWFTSTAPSAPVELMRLLNSHPLTRNTVFTEGWPEHVTQLPERGEGRNHDLMLRGRSDQPITVCVEAKADEPFGELIADEWRVRTNAAGHPTRKGGAARRLQILLALLFGAKADPARSPWSEMRYQLVTAAAGTVIQAVRNDSAVGVLVVHEFLTSKADRAEKVPRNGSDFAWFVGHLVGVPADRIESGVLYGPVRIPRQQHLAHEVDLLVGKILFDWNLQTAPVQLGPRKDGAT